MSAWPGSDGEQRQSWGPGELTALLLTCLITVFGLGLPVLFRLRRVLAQAAADERATSDAILVLGRQLEADRPTVVFHERLEHALGLWQAKTAPALVITGGLTGTANVTEAEAGRQHLLSSGVPEAAIYCEDESRNTLENLFNVRELARAQGWSCLTLVSDPLHLARASAFAGGLGLEVRCSPAVACPPSRQSLRWWARAVKEAFFLHWYAVGMAYSRLTRSERLLRRVT